MVMKRTRYGQKLTTSARRQFKLSEPNWSIRSTPSSSPSSENVNRTPFVISQFYFHTYPKVPVIYCNAVTFQFYRGNEIFARCQVNWH